MKAKHILFGSLILLCSGLAKSQDLGEFGETFTIIEKDLREVIMIKLQEMQKSGLLEQHQKLLQNKIRERVLSPKAQELPEATQQREFYYDPTIVVTEDLSDGEGQIFKRKGEKINPLDTYQFKGTWVFFDARKDKQKEFALHLHSQKEAKLILTAGKPLELMEKLNTEVYFDQFGWLIKKFEIKQLPAIVMQDGKRLKIIEQDLRLWKK